MLGAYIKQIYVHNRVVALKMFSVAEKFNSSYFWTLVQEDSWMCQLLINCHKFSGKLGFNFGVGLWMLSHKKNKWCSTHTAQVWRLSTCLSRWICTTPRSPGCNRNLGLIVTILQLSSQVQHHHYPHPVCQYSFITIDYSLSAPLLQVDFFNLHHLQFHGRCWCSATFPGVERSVYYSAHARDRVASLIQSSQEFAFVTSIR